jgi:hypothetical protein
VSNENLATRGGENEVDKGCRASSILAIGQHRYRVTPTMVSARAATSVA